MFGSNLLDIAIGLILTYLLLSLIVTAVNELIATFFRSRARDLERGIRNLLDGTSEFPLRWWQPAWRSVWGIVRRFLNRKKEVAEMSKTSDPAVTDSWSNAFFKHRLVDGLSKNTKKPSYIPSRTFAMVLLQLAKRSADANSKLKEEDVLATGAPMNGMATFDDIRTTIEAMKNRSIKDALLPLLEEARSNVTDAATAMKKFSDQVEIWYNHAMDRVGGWYKSRTQGFLFCIAAVVTVTLNVDTIVISQSLAKDEVLRAAMLETAKKYVESPAPLDASQPANIEKGLKAVQTAIAEVDGLGIPIGWNKSIWDELTIRKLMGLFLTTIAVSLGAPFWFDTLKKVISIRGAGKAPIVIPKKTKEDLRPPAAGGAAVANP
ncbi:MAG: hypothetical protein AABZ47_03055 [Planctomycetota bacterium]